MQELLYQMLMEQSPSKAETSLRILLFLCFKMCAEVMQ